MGSRGVAFLLDACASRYSHRLSLSDDEEEVSEETDEGYNSHEGRHPLPASVGVCDRHCRGGDGYAEAEPGHYPGHVTLHDFEHGLLLRIGRT